MVVVNGTNRNGHMFCLVCHRALAVLGPLVFSLYINDIMV